MFSLDRWQTPPMHMHMTFGERIRRERNRRVWTREQLAEKIGSSLATIKKFEGMDRPPLASKYVPRIEELFRIDLTSADPPREHPVGAADLTDAELLTELATRLLHRPPEEDLDDDDDDGEYGPPYQSGHGAEQQ